VIAAEGAETFQAFQDFLDVAVSLAAERRLSRWVFMLGRRADPLPDGAGARRRGRFVGMAASPSEEPQGTKIRIGRVTRSFFEFARPAAPRRPRWGIQTVQRARHLFRQHCLATPDTMVHLRMAAEESHRGVVRQGSGACQQLPGWRHSPRVSGRLLSSSADSGQAERP
jgi:hypothetical protein